MIHAARCLSIFAIALCLVGLASAQQPVPANVEIPEDKAGWQQLAEKFFSAYTREDLDGLLRMWSANSPEFPAFKQRTQQQFATWEKVTVKDVTVRPVSEDGARAKLRVELEMNAMDAKTGKPAEGLGKLLRALECVKEEGVWRVWREASAYGDLATALGEAKTDEARQTLLAANEELIAQPLVDALISQGHQHRQRGQYAAALVSYRTARGVAERLGDRRGLALALSNIGASHALQSDYAQALPFLEQGLKLAEELNDKTIIGFTLNVIGSVHRSMGNIESALDFLRRSQKLSEEQGNHAATANALYNLGTVYAALGDQAQALSHYERTLMLTPPSDKEFHQTILLAIGNVHRQQGHYELALDYYQQGLRLTEESGIKPSSLLLNSIGIVHRLQGKPDLALEFYQRALALAEAQGVKTDQGLILNNIGIIHRTRGQHEQAIKVYEQSLKLRESSGDRAGAAHVLYNLAFTHQKQGRLQEALDYAERSIALARQINSPAPLWNALLTKGAVYLARRQPEVARQAYEEAVAVIEGVRDQVAGSTQDAQRLFESKVFPYHALVALLAEEGKVSAALGYAERAKARALLDVLQGRGGSVAKSLNAAEREQEQTLNRELIAFNTQLGRESRRAQPVPTKVAELKEKLQKARLDLEAFQTKLYAAHPELKAQRGEARLITAKEALGLLPNATTALLEYVVTEEKTFLFVLTRGEKLQVFPLAIAAKDLGARAEAFRQQLARRDPEFGTAARELYDLLMKPAAKQLRGKTALVIVPDGPLWELPFQTLQPALGRYLIESQSISYTPSLTVLREMAKARKKRSNRASTLLAFGNPTLGQATVSRAKTTLMDEKFEPLPDAEDQVRKLARIYGSRRSRIYIGAEAHEERVKAEATQHRILHLATHGVLNNASPLYSHLLLAQTEGEANEAREAKEDGLLEAWELMKLNLNADLVVLSACETARGRVGAGEGVIGLTWALFVAGCPRTVVSQWKVESASTTKLMVEFHRQLNGHIEKPSARLGTAHSLRAASLKMLRSGQYRHPFWWAGFVVVGDGF